MDEFDFEPEDTDPFYEEKVGEPFNVVFSRPDWVNSNDNTYTSNTTQNTFTNNAGCIGSGIQFHVNGNTEMSGDLVMRGDDGRRFKIKIDAYGNIYTEPV